MHVAVVAGQSGCYLPAGLVGGMVLPGLVTPELPGTPVPAPLEVPLLPLEPPMLLPELSGMPLEEPDMPAAPEPPVPVLPEAPELSGMLLPLLPEAPEPPAERPDIELHAASVHTHATSAICFIMKFLLSLKDTAHVQLLSEHPRRCCRRTPQRYLPAHQ